MSSCPKCGYEDEDRLKVGDVLYGFCQGEFGRDSYGDKTVEAIGSDWVLVREGRFVHAWNGDPQDLTQYRIRRCWVCDSEFDDGVCPNGCDGDY